VIPSLNRSGSVTRIPIASKTFRLLSGGGAKKRRVVRNLEKQPWTTPSTPPRLTPLSFSDFGNAVALALLREEVFRPSLTDETQHDEAQHDEAQHDEAQHDEAQHDETGVATSRQPRHDEA
jgi:hypothetical protein